MQTTATLQTVEQQGSILVFTFITETDEEYILLGDFRMCQPLVEYVSKKVRLTINGIADWSWRTLDECEPEFDE